MREKQQRWRDVLLDLVLPQRCRVCDIPLRGQCERVLCAACREQIRYIGPSICCRCGTELLGKSGSRHWCGNCLKMPPPFTLALSVVSYGPPVSDLLHCLKYAADTTVLPAFAEIAEPFDRSSFAECDFIVPVPLHRIRLQQRGLNQSLLLARVLFPEQPKNIVTHLLRREKQTIPQTGLDGIARRKNLHSAFRIPEPKEVLGKCICLVDDVYTTGTTVTACSSSLLLAGAAEVKVVTFARVSRRT